jgi:hypothetical protein
MLTLTGLRKAFGSLVAVDDLSMRVLRQAFGNEYEAYTVRTWRLLPGVW